MDEREAGYYYHTISDFIQLIGDYGVEQVAHDLKAANPRAFEDLQKIALVERDRSKQAALFQYKDAFFKDYEVDTNS